MRKKSLTPNDAHPLPFLEDTHEVRLHYEQSLPPSSPTCFTYLRNIKQLTELEIGIYNPPSTRGHGRSSRESKPNDDSESTDDSDSANDCDYQK